MAQFKKGVSGNPTGMKPGTRHRLQNAFLADLLAAWEHDGKDALKLMVRENPVKSVQVCAGLMQKEVALDVAQPLGEMSDDELQAALQSIRQLRADAIAGVVIDAADDAPAMKVISNARRKA
jgi:hypothetical protein